MRNSITLLLLSFSCALFAQDTFQLAPPLIKYHSVFFTNKTFVELKFAQSNTSIYYTLINQEPTVNDAVYKKPILIKNNFTTIKAKVGGNNFHSSATVAVTFIKDGIPVRAIKQTLPNTKYPGNGANTLNDNKGGIANVNSNTWMGYNCDTVTVLLDLGKQQAVQKVLLNFLQSENSWVFMPDEIEVLWFDNRSNSFKPFAKEVLFAEKETPGTHSKYKVLATNNKIVTSKISISILVKKNIPAWHVAKGEHGWMFLDEIKVY